MGAGQAALAVVVVGGSAVAALLLSSGGGSFHRGRGPLGSGGAVASAVALGVAVTVWAARRWRGRFARYAAYSGAAERRFADTVRSGLILAPVAVPVLLLALHRFPAHPDSPPEKDEPAPVAGPPQAERGAHHLPLWTLEVVGCLLLAVVVAVLAYAIRHLVQLLLTPDRPSPGAPQGRYGPIDDGELLARAVDSARRALRGSDDARAAVIACYAAMETSLAASGMARRASDSPQDLLERTVGSGLLTGSAGPDLFREARYSSHPMDDGHRRRAAHALAAIADQLDRRAAAAGRPQDTEGAQLAAEGVPGQAVPGAGTSAGPAVSANSRSEP